MPIRTARTWLHTAPDRAIWEYARSHDFTLVSKDDDFRYMSLTYGPPPKVVWLSVGNASTAEVRGILLERREGIAAFIASPTDALLVLTKR